MIKLRVCECMTLICCDSVSLRVNGLLHTGQWNCGFWPHSNLICLVSVPFNEYFLPHLLQLNPPGDVILSDIGDKVNSCFESFLGFVIFNSTVHDRPGKNKMLVKHYPYIFTILITYNAVKTLYCHNLLNKHYLQLYINYKWW